MHGVVQEEILEAERILTDAGMNAFNALMDSAMRMAAVKPGYTSGEFSDIARIYAMCVSAVNRLREYRWKRMMEW